MGFHSGSFPRRDKGQRLSDIVTFRDVVVGTATYLAQALLRATRTLTLIVRSCVVHSSSTKMPSPLPVRLPSSNAPTTNILLHNVGLERGCVAKVAVPSRNRSYRGW